MGERERGRERERERDSAFVCACVNSFWGGETCPMFV